MNYVERDIESWRRVRVTWSLSTLGEAMRALPDQAHPVRPRLDDVFVRWMRRASAVLTVLPRFRPW